MPSIEEALPEVASVAAELESLLVLFSVAVSFEPLLQAATNNDEIAMPKIKFFMIWELYDV